jgi:hypothetical protein
MALLRTDPTAGPTWRGRAFGALTWGERSSERPTWGRQTLGCPRPRGRGRSARMSRDEDITPVAAEAFAVVEEPA